MADAPIRPNRQFNNVGPRERLAVAEHQAKQDSRKRKAQLTFKQRENEREAMAIADAFHALDEKGATRKDQISLTRLLQQRKEKNEAEKAKAKAAGKDTGATPKDLTPFQLGNSDPSTSMQNVSKGSLATAIEQVEGGKGVQTANAGDGALQDLQNVSAPSAPPFTIQQNTQTTTRPEQFGTNFLPTRTTQTGFQANPNVSTPAQEAAVKIQRAQAIAGVHFQQMTQKFQDEMLKNDTDKTGAVIKLYEAQSKQYLATAAWYTQRGIPTPITKYFQAAYPQIYGTGGGGGGGPGSPGGAGGGGGAGNLKPNQFATRLAGNMSEIMGADGAFKKNLSPAHMDALVGPHLTGMDLFPVVKNGIFNNIQSATSYPDVIRDIMILEGYVTANPEQLKAAKAHLKSTGQFDVTKDGVVVDDDALAPNTARIAMEMAAASRQGGPVAHLARDFMEQHGLRYPPETVVDPATGGGGGGEVEPTADTPIGPQSGAFRAGQGVSPLLNNMGAIAGNAALGIAPELEQFFRGVAGTPGETIKRPDLPSGPHALSNVARAAQHIRPGVDEDKIRRSREFEQIFSDFTKGGGGPSSIPQASPQIPESQLVEAIMGLGAGGPRPPVRSAQGVAGPSAPIPERENDLRLPDEVLRGTRPNAQPSPVPSNRPNNLLMELALRRGQRPQADPLSSLNRLDLLGAGPTTTPLRAPALFENLRADAILRKKQNAEKLRRGKGMNRVRGGGRRRRNTRKGGPKN